MVHDRDLPFEEENQEDPTDDSTEEAGWQVPDYANDTSPPSGQGTERPPQHEPRSAANQDIPPICQLAKNNEGKWDLAIRARYPVLLRRRETAEWALREDPARLEVALLEASGLVFGSAWKRMKQWTRKRFPGISDADAERHIGHACALAAFSMSPLKDNVLIQVGEGIDDPEFSIVKCLMGVINRTGV